MARYGPSRGGRYEIIIVMEGGHLSRSSQSWFVPFWIVVASFVLIAAALARCEFMGWWYALIVVHMGTNGTTSEGDPVPIHLCRTIPATLGVCSLVALWIRNRKIRGAVLTLTAFLALILCYGNVYFVGTQQRALGNWIEMMVAAAMVAAGNRTMLLVPGSRLPRVLSGLGGAKLFLSFLVSGDDYIQRSILSQIVMDGFSGRGWEIVLFGTLLLIYAILGTLNPFARRPPTIRCRAVSIIGYLLLVAFPFVLYQMWMDMTGRGPEPVSSYHFAFLLKFWLLSTGFTLLLAVGLASWVEELLKKRESVPENPAVDLSQARSG
jgi:hypothetical protein